MHNLTIKLIHARELGHVRWVRVHTGGDHRIIKVCRGAGGEFEGPSRLSVGPWNHVINARTELHVLYQVEVRCEFLDVGLDLGASGVVAPRVLHRVIRELIELLGHLQAVARGWGGWGWGGG